MARIVKENESFDRVEMDRNEAIQFCRDLGQSLKVEHIETGLAERRACRSIVRASSSTCAADPISRVPARSGLQAAVGGRGLLEGRFQRQQLQRLYGTAWFSNRRWTTT